MITGVPVARRRGGGGAWDVTVVTAGSPSILGSPRVTWGESGRVCAGTRRGKKENVAEANQVSAAAAVQILKIKAQTLEDCAREVMLDRPDLYRKWTGEARQLRIMAGEDVDDESED